MKILFASFGLLCCVLATAQKPFVIDGKITNSNADKIYLFYSSGKSYVTDSSVIKNGVFHFAGKIAYPVEAYCSLSPDLNDVGEQGFTKFFLEDKKMKLAINNDKFTEAVLTGSKTEEENGLLKKRLREIEIESRPVEEELRKQGAIYRKAIDEKAAPEVLDSLKYIDAGIRSRLEPFDERKSVVTQQFFREYPNSYVTLSKLPFETGKMSIDALEKIIAAFSPQIKSTPPAKNIIKEAKQIRAAWPGSIAPQFSAKDINNAELKLADFKGKYILLDFWASWCVPCRKGNPHLKELYQKYHDKGIEFIGISDDDSNPALWKKAVEKDGLPWHHVLRGLDWGKLNKGIENESDISNKYAIHYLPTKILIDRSGKIIGRYGESEEQLDSQLKEIFGF